MSVPIKVIVKPARGYCQCGCGRKTWVASKTSAHYGHRKGEPVRYLRGHGTRRDEAARFWEKVAKADEDACWLWQGAVGSTGSTGGYGRFGRSDRRTIGAHRVAWELTKGRIPKGLCVCHKCDVPACCNPAHLFLGTVKDNVADMMKKERGIILRGERNIHSKLTEAQVREIRARYTAGVFGYGMLAREYGVTKHAIKKVIDRTTWQHVAEE